MKHGTIDEDGNCVLGGLPPTMCHGCVELARKGQMQARPEVFTWGDAAEARVRRGHR